MPFRMPQGNNVQRRERDPIMSPRQRTAFISEFAPKELHQALTGLNEDPNGYGPCHFPIQSTSLNPDGVRISPAASRLWYTCPFAIPEPVRVFATQTRQVTTILAINNAVAPFGTRGHCARSVNSCHTLGTTAPVPQGLALVIKFLSGSATTR